MNKTTLNSQKEKHSMLSLRRATDQNSGCCRRRHQFLSTLSLRRATVVVDTRWLDVQISIHALLAESDASAPVWWTRCNTFLSTLSLRRATEINRRAHTLADISIHALLAESDPGMVISIGTGDEFLSTLSLRRATRPFWACVWLNPDFYPRSPCGERLPAATSSTLGGVFLSTLSLRRATTLPRKDCHHQAISIHALLAESDARSPAASLLVTVFLSTLSLRRATFSAAIVTQHPRDFYPRSPCGERQWVPVYPAGLVYLFLSTLSLRRATRVNAWWAWAHLFLSTLSLRRATRFRCI